MTGIAGALVNIADAELEAKPDQLGAVRVIFLQRFWHFSSGQRLPATVPFILCLRALATDSPTEKKDAR